MPLNDLDGVKTGIIQRLGRAVSRRTRSGDRSRTSGAGGETPPLQFDDLPDPLFGEKRWTQVSRPGGTPVKAPRAWRPDLVTRSAALLALLLGGAVCSRSTLSPSDFCKDHAIHSSGLAEPAECTISADADPFGTCEPADSVSDAADPFGTCEYTDSVPEEGANSQDHGAEEGGMAPATSYNPTDLGGNSQDPPYLQSR